MLCGLLFTFSVVSPGVLPQCSSRGGSGTTIKTNQLFSRTTELRCSVGVVCDEQIVPFGGCGGPYALDVVKGSLPPGLSLGMPLAPNNARPFLTGTPTAAGLFAVDLRIVDQGCLHFEEATCHVVVRVTDPHGESSGPLVR